MALVTGASGGIGADLARELAIDVLINNAGLGANGPFHNSDLTRIREMVLVNVLALTELTSLLLPGMVSRRRGRIMLVGSAAGFQPGPHMAVYCATKACVLSFGESLAWELRGTSVTVTVLCPGATATNFSQTAEAKNTPLFSLTPVMSSREVARTGYLCMKAGRTVVVTGLINKLLGLGGRYMPRFMSLPISEFLIRSK